ncbi:lipase domain-containing protein [Phthorimaea operculella]|nr:lipase domain-containing protein [Phthorimaea operculella]
MLKLKDFCLLLFVGVVAAIPASPIFGHPDKDLRYQYATDSNGQAHLVDLWMTIDNAKEAARFNPQLTNEYHLFTRNNPTVSQPILLNNAAQLTTTNFSASRRTIMLIHGWRQDASSDIAAVLVPAFLAVEDVNIIVVDWSAGASSLLYRVVIANTITSGAAVARFITWLNQASGATLAQYHIVGHGFGGHQAGIVGRNLGGNVAYITGLNPALVGWVNNINRFLPNDGIYTEVIHTNYLIGYIEALAQVDFYPNGGISMPGCDSNQCDDLRSIFYFAESLSSGGFTGIWCFNHYAAVLSLCGQLSRSSQMGGLAPKTGSSGVYWLETNAAPPFSQD